MPNISGITGYKIFLLYNLFLSKQKRKPVIINKQKKQIKLVISLYAPAINERNIDIIQYGLFIDNYFSSLIQQKKNNKNENNGM